MFPTFALAIQRAKIYRSDTQRCKLQGAAIFNRNKLGFRFREVLENEAQIGLKIVAWLQIEMELKADPKISSYKAGLIS